MAKNEDFILPALSFQANVAVKRFAGEEDSRQKLKGMLKRSAVASPKVHESHPASVQLLDCAAFYRTSLGAKGKRKLESSYFLGHGRGP